MTEPNGFYYMRARYYDPQVGRFISEDPIGFDGGDVNLMAYAGNNPVMRIDPLGLWTLGINFGGNAGVGFGGGGVMSLNFGWSSKDGFSFSLTSTASGGAVAGAGASVGIGVTYTNASNVNQLNGSSSLIGRSGLGPVTIEGVAGSDYNGVTGTFNIGRPFGYTASSISTSTTSAIYQYSNGVQSIGNTGINSIWSSKCQ
jgi:RHS repeat-associated protein